MAQNKREKHKKAQWSERELHGLSTLCAGGSEPILVLKVSRATESGDKARNRLWAPLGVSQKLKEKKTKTLKLKLVH